MRSAYLAGRWNHVVSQYHRASITADELRSTPFIGAAASDLLQTRILCVADTLPASLGLTDLRIVGGELTVTLRGTAVPTDQTALAVTGSC